MCAINYRTSYIHNAFAFRKEPGSVILASLMGNDARVAAKMAGVVKY